jgi:hypothetical protein
VALSPLSTGTPAEHLCAIVIGGGGVAIRAVISDDQSTASITQQSIVASTADADISASSSVSSVSGSLSVSQIAATVTCEIV